MYIKRFICKRKQFSPDDVIYRCSFVCFFVQCHFKVNVYLFSNISFIYLPILFNADRQIIKTHNVCTNIFPCLPLQKYVIIKQLEKKRSDIRTTHSGRTSICLDFLQLNNNLNTFDDNKF